MNPSVRSLLPFGLVGLLGLANGAACSTTPDSSEVGNARGAESERQGETSLGRDAGASERQTHLESTSSGAGSGETSTPRSIAATSEDERSTGAEGTHTGSASAPAESTVTSSASGGPSSAPRDEPSSTLGACDFALLTNEISSGMATVGVVEWSLAGDAPTSAKIVYSLSNGSDAILNTGGEAPVDLTKPNYRTLLLGLKQASDYVFRVEATRDDETCTSETFQLPTTGTLEGPSIGSDVVQPNAREPGFILTTGGYQGSGAFILDADGAVVWYSSAPKDPGRIRMDYDGENMWMLGLNPLGGEGELRVVSMDGQQRQEALPGFQYAHHDFAVMPGGKVAVLVWRFDFSGGNVTFDPESDLVIRHPDGTLVTAFGVGANLYASETFHSNAIQYIPTEDAFTISDRNPDLIVKVSSSGEVLWQLGGSCADAPAGAEKCSAQTWSVSHGHHLLADGTLLIFNNNLTEDTSQVSHVLEYAVDASLSRMSAELVKDYTGSVRASILGDVQRLPGGNTLITYSSSSGSAGTITEVDADWNTVQSFSGAFGYADWRPTLYGPPAR